MQIIPAQTILTLTYQTGVLSFNDAILKKLVEDRKLTVSNKRVGNQNVVVFSNEKFLFMILPQNQLQFMITGQCSVIDIIKDIQEILTALNYNLSSNVRLGFQCETRLSVNEDEHKKFTKELCLINYRVLEEKLGTTDTLVTGLKLHSKSITSNTEIIFEPVPNTKTYSLLLGYTSTEQNDYTKFITDFNVEYLEVLINGIFVN